MDRIKFGTDGWRGVIAHQFTVANVSKLTHAVAIWLLKKFKEPEVVVGYDTRFLGKLFAETAAKVLASKGIRVKMTDDFVTTPMVSLAVRELKASLGIMITASHNDYTYNGYKLKGNFGGPLQAADLKNIEDLISSENNIDLDLLKWDQFVVQELIQFADLEALYFQFISSYFDLENLRNAGIRIGFDAMYGSAQKIIRKILPEATLFRAEPDPTFGHTAPEPLEKNLQELIRTMQSSDNLDLTLAVDGDGDRIALVDKAGDYIDSHTIILILVHYFARYRKMSGKVVTGFSTTMKVEKLCRHYDLEVMRVPIGFKDICRVMLTEDVLVGGEESGGISVSGYIPERDGIWMGLMILQFMAETGKSLEDILLEIHDLTGRFKCIRRDFTLPKEKRARIMEICYKGEIENFDRFHVTRVEALDGIKFFLGEDEWVMVRSSGTEPLLRLYAEATDVDAAEKIIQTAYNTLSSMTEQD
jgi:phosphomannomutase